MELYDEVSRELSRTLTIRYSSSFSLSSRLFDKNIQPHIYAIYGLVRIADEIVDTYRGNNQAKLLDTLESETYRALTDGYSTNPIVHAFAKTAQQYGIEKSLIAPFFASMRMDIGNAYTADDYEAYIYGSAEVIGLMCLKVFCDGDTSLYKETERGARALGAAYQKINFLRDLADDYERLGRAYFPNISIDDFQNTDRDSIIADIKNDLLNAKTAIQILPKSTRRAVAASYTMYMALTKKLSATPAEEILKSRIRITSSVKVYLAIRSLVSGGRL